MATSPLPLPRVIQPVRELPDYVPARMVNEHVYCPRLFYYMWVESVFRESVDTVEGSAQHSRVDKQTRVCRKLRTLLSMRRFTAGRRCCPASDCG